MNTFTSMAVDAFRAQESTRRRLMKAEAKCIDAARFVTDEERNVWFMSTEIIRFEFDLQDAKDNHDQETYDAVYAMLIEMRGKLARADAQLEADKALADKEDRPITPGEGVVGRDVPPLPRPPSEFVSGRHVKGGKHEKP